MENNLKTTETMPTTLGKRFHILVVDTIRKRKIRKLVFPFDPFTTMDLQYPQFTEYFALKVFKFMTVSDLVKLYSLSKGYRKYLVDKCNLEYAFLDRVYHKIMTGNNNEFFKEEHMFRLIKINAMAGIIENFNTLFMNGDVEYYLMLIFYLYFQPRIFCEDNHVPRHIRPTLKGWLVITSTLPWVIRPNTLVPRDICGSYKGFQNVFGLVKDEKHMTEIANRVGPLDDTESRIIDNIVSHEADQIDIGIVHRKRASLEDVMAERYKIMKGGVLNYWMTDVQTVVLTNTNY